MNPSMLRSLIRECIKEILDEELKKACSYCELINPPRIKSTNVSHGYCREHSIAAYHQLVGWPIEKARKFVDSRAFDLPPNTSNSKDTDPLPRQD